ncbi:hypothetical protein [Micromonospora sp. DT233]|uniref:hypothetical protein n=1 Tax=Micromonospora sp. DT233 TaxID=3393432 RepID=UPI003CE8784A
MTVPPVPDDVDAGPPRPRQGTVDDAEAAGGPPPRPRQGTVDDAEAAGGPPPRPRQGTVDDGPPTPQPVDTRHLDERRARASQSFWAAVVAVPAVFLVLRLGVEAGGELQTTLLLVSNVGPTNLLAGFLTTAAGLLATGLVAVFALGAVLGTSVDHLPGHRRPLFVRWADITPAWFVVASFLLALITWPLLYLPLLLPALVAAFQLHVRRLHDLPVVRALIVAAIFGGYLYFLAPTLLDAAKQGELLVIVLFVVPPLLALGIAGPLPGAVIRPLASITEAAVLLMLVWAALPVISTPVLPLTAITVETGPTTTEDVRGYVVTVDDVSMVLLLEQGGVRFVPIGQVKAQVLCPSETKFPRRQLWVRHFNVEDSLLEGRGRRLRDKPESPAACLPKG